MPLVLGSILINDQQADVFKLIRSRSGEGKFSYHGPALFCYTSYSCCHCGFRFEIIECDDILKKDSTLEIQIKDYY